MVNYSWDIDKLLFLYFGLFRWECFQVEFLRLLNSVWELPALRLWQGDGQEAGQERVTPEHDGRDVGVIILAQHLYPGGEHAAEPAQEGGAPDARGPHLRGQKLRRVEEQHGPGEGDAHLAHQAHGHSRPVVSIHAPVLEVKTAYILDRYLTFHASSSQSWVN